MYYTSGKYISKGVDKHLLFSVEKNMEKDMVVLLTCTSKDIDRNHFYSSEMRINYVPESNDTPERIFYQENGILTNYDFCSFNVYEHMGNIRVEFEPTKKEKSVVCFKVLELV